MGVKRWGSQVKPTYLLAAAEPQVELRSSTESMGLPVVSVWPPEKSELIESSPRPDPRRRHRHKYFTLPDYLTLPYLT